MLKESDVGLFSTDISSSDYISLSSSFEKLEQKFYKLQKEYVESKKSLEKLHNNVEIMVPVSIFNNNKLSALELIVRYLKENKQLKNKFLAEKINRDPRTTWATYNSAVKKSTKKLIINSKYNFPVSIIKIRKLSVLESIVDYLSTYYKLDSKKISVLLYRDENTILTVLRRIRIKNAQ